MRKLALTRLFHVLIATASVAACGGAIADVDADEGDDPQTDADGGDTSDAGKKMADASADTSSDVVTTTTDARRDVTDANRPDVFTGCANGLIDPDPTLCCTTQSPPDPKCQSQGSGDANHCALDCPAVCERVAPGSTTSGGFESCYWTASATSPKISYTCGQCGVGRIPEDTVPCDRGARIGDRLARQAYYEAASVVAFDRLAEVLAQAGAPAKLVERVRRASADERRHTATFTRLARARGVVASEPALGPASPTLYELALENATEGCVRETYGALVLLHQAEHAADPELRAAFARVARDEIAHAALSWDLARWFEARLDAPERAKVREAQREAERALRSAADDAPDGVDRELGLPSRAVAASLCARLFDALPALAA
jgi:hypothetical protein